MPNGVEIKGSRRSWEDGRYKYGEQLWIATTFDDATVPVYGAGFVTPGDVTETAPTGRMATNLTRDPEAIPGIWLFRIIYRGFRLYA